MIGPMKGKDPKGQSGYSKEDQEKIRKRAYSIWEKRGKPSTGTATQDWLQAERELRAQGLIGR